MDVITIALSQMNEYKQKQKRKHIIVTLTVASELSRATLIGLLIPPSLSLLTIPASLLLLCAFCWVSMCTHANISAAVASPVPV